jgi:hypothetical protein
MPEYRAPMLIPFGVPPAVSGAYCAAGGSPDGPGTYCEAGTIAISGDPGYCAAGETASPGYCTAGQTAATACTEGTTAAASCTDGGTVYT